MRVLALVALLGCEDRLWGNRTVAMYPEQASMPVDDGLVLHVANIDVRHDVRPDVQFQNLTKALVLERVTVDAEHFHGTTTEAFLDDKGRIHHAEWRPEGDIRTEDAVGARATFRIEYRYGEQRRSVEVVYRR
jgi:hypothetical protein